jgi:hypothetical protein
VAQRRRAQVAVGLACPRSSGAARRRERPYPSVDRDRTEAAPAKSTKERRTADVSFFTAGVSRAAEIAVSDVRGPGTTRRHIDSSSITSTCPWSRPGQRYGYHIQ